MKKFILIGIIAFLFSACARWKPTITATSNCEKLYDGDKVTSGDTLYFSESNSCSIEFQFHYGDYWNWHFKPDLISVPEIGNSKLHIEVKARFRMPNNFQYSGLFTVNVFDWEMNTLDTFKVYIRRKY